MDTNKTNNQPNNNIFDEPKTINPPTINDDTQNLNQNVDNNHGKKNMRNRKKKQTQLFKIEESNSYQMISLLIMIRNIIVKHILKM